MEINRKLVFFIEVGPSWVKANNNTIVNCNQGIRVKDESVALIDQVTFYNNAYDVVALEKNIGSGGGLIESYNSIFSNTVYVPILKDTISDIIVDYSL